MAKCINLYSLNAKHLRLRSKGSGACRVVAWVSVVAYEFANLRKRPISQDRTFRSWLFRKDLYFIAALNDVFIQV